MDNTYQPTTHELALADIAEFGMFNENGAELGWADLPQDELTEM